MVSNLPNIEKLLQNIDSILGFLSSVPWWGWVLIMFGFHILINWADVSREVSREISRSDDNRDDQSPK
jgi:hypothetical protein